MSTLPAPAPQASQSPAAAHSASILTAAVADCDAGIVGYETAADAAARADNEPPPRRPRDRCRFADHHASYDIRI